MTNLNVYNPSLHVSRITLQEPSFKSKSFQIIEVDSPPLLLSEREYFAYNINLHSYVHFMTWAMHRATLMNLT